MINGTNLPHHPANATVYIGSTPTSCFGGGSGFLLCAAPELETGKYIVKVLVDGVGLAVGVNSIDFQLSVYAISPTIGKYDEFVKLMLIDEILLLLCEYIDV